MNTLTQVQYGLIDPVELNTFKEKTDQLMQNLECNDFVKAMQCIHEINDINDQSMCNIIGKLTRGLHDAIAGLSLPTENRDLNDHTRPSLDYVIQVTSQAASRTLDMTEQASTCVRDLMTGFDRQSALLDQLAEGQAGSPELEPVIRELRELSSGQQSRAELLNGSITEIVVAQNYQDLASQSITKATGIIKNVESSLVSLTQYANLLKTLAQYSRKDEPWLDPAEKEEIRSSIGQLDKLASPEHLGQDDVDDLLSSLGF